MQRVERSLASGVDDHVIKCAHLFRWGGNHIRNPGGRLRSRPDDGLLDTAGHCPESRLNFRTACSCASDTACVRGTCAAAAPLQPEQPTTTAIPAPESQPQAQQVKEVQAPLEKQVEKPDTRRAEAEQRERRRRSAERKAKKLATARARQQFEQQSREREPGIMAFGGNEQPRMIGFLGN